MKKVFIDGKAGTTGLRIEERLSMRDDIEIVTLPDELRKDPTAKKDPSSSLSTPCSWLCSCPADWPFSDSFQRPALLKPSLTVLRALPGHLLW